MSYKPIKVGDLLPYYDDDSGALIEIAEESNGDWTDISIVRVESELMDFIKDREIKCMGIVRDRLRIEI